MPAAFLLGGGPDFSQLLTELVVHWLLTFPRFAGLFPVSRRASGPLDGVDHWLLAFSRFSGLFPISGRASGPLSRVGH